jgi:uncharacterized protein YabN with tetrapyrrole methylase and pyrophosphatase domain
MVLKRNVSSLLRGVPRSASSLSRATLLARRASLLGFDWPDVSGVLKKMEEELGELQEALSTGNRRRIAEELGDLFFVLVNVARFFQIDPEAALQGTVKKFIDRFQFIETSLRKAGKSVEQSSLEEMDQLWEKAKRRSRRLRSKTPQH